MKKIIISLSIIAALAAVVVYGTTAFFSDTEKSVGNTFTAGTIDIAIDNTNPWTGTYNLPDLKPGETGNLTFKVQNVGANPVDVSKRIYGFVESTGSTGYQCASVGAVSSEPECVAAQANSDVDKNDIQSQIIYDLDVHVYAGVDETTPIWWQQIYDASQNQSLTNVYGADGSKYVELGMIPVGGHMVVTQSYHFSEAAGNEYQGDQLTFNMEIKGDQLAQADGYNTVVLENKGGAPDWQILNQDSVKGTLAYKTTGPKFLYAFSATVNTPNINYTLVYVGPSGNFPYSGQVVLGTGTASGNSISLNGDVVTGTITGGKVWLVPTTTYPAGWDNANNLYETALINYVQN